MEEAVDSVVWVVSFRVNELGKPQEYSIDEFDLSRCNSNAARTIRAEMGKGVFRTEEEAQKWVEANLKKGCGGCCDSKSGCGKGCTRAK